MIRQAFLFSIGMLGLVLTAPGAASTIHHAPLEDVLWEADWVMVATVEKVEVREDNVQKLFTWTVRKDRELRSKTPVPDLPLTYSHRWPVLFNERGVQIGTISPIYDGSGREHEVEEGQTWIFMGKALTSEGAEVLFVDRVEPLALEEQINMLLLDRWVGESNTPSTVTTPYAPPKTRPGEDGWQRYHKPITWNAKTVVDTRPGNASPEAAAVHYLASRVRGDRLFEQVLPEAGQRGERLERQLEEHDQWSFTAFKLVGRKQVEPGLLWIKVWMEIGYEGDLEAGEDELTVRNVGGNWVVVEVPT